MKNRIKVVSLMLILPLSILAQQEKKIAAKEKPPTQADMARMMEDEMKGMSEEDKTEMRKLMKGIIPEMAKKPGSTVVAFSNNKQLVPAKDPARIRNISKIAFTDADVVANTALLYSKLMSRIPASEKAIVTMVMAKAKTGPSLMEAATVSFMQGHNYVAIGLAIKAVQADPRNVIHQNNLAAILSQSGYPEKAIPYLKKLNAQFPSNSTVLHNLGYAWLQLGEPDTARRFFNYAGARNPDNPETALCRGVMAELEGDPKKAADLYVEAFGQAPNPFTQNMAKNVNAENRLDIIDFNKLKSRITTYQYFKKDWIKIPVLTDDVAHYEADSKIKNGYSKMFQELNAKIESGVEASMAEIEALADKGLTDFATTMMKESQKGISMMSMPALYIQKIIQAHIAKWQAAYVTEYHDLLEGIQERKVIMTKYDNNDKCPDYDRKNNEFLRYANPIIRQFHEQKIEEAREWLNVFCTWSWYVAGNPKNTVLTQCISWTALLAEMYESAVRDQYAIAKTCVQQNNDGIANIATPAIPNFTCPAVVSIPFGLDELRLSADAVNFDDNDWGIKKLAGGKDQNLTLAYGIDKNYITEPGKYGNPFAKSGNGSITPPGMGINDLTPLSKVMDELTPLSKVPIDELSPLNPDLLDVDKKSAANNLRKGRNAAMARQLLNEMTRIKCPGELPPKKTRKEKFEVSMGKLELTEWNEDLAAWVNDKGELMYDKNGKPFGNMEVTMGELQILDWNEDLSAWVDQNGEAVYDKNGKAFGKLELGVGELEFEDIQTSGLQMVINNGLDAVGTVANFIKGLFD